jgi:hypothetical protein
MTTNLTRFESRLRYLSRPAIDCTYEQYTAALHSAAYDRAVTAGISTDLVLKAKGWLKEIKSVVELPIADLLQSLSHHSVFKLLRSVKFNLNKLFQGVVAAMSLMRKGLSVSIQKLSKSGTFDKLRSGAVSLDQVIQAHPLLAKLTGVALAGLLFYMWLNMSFTGDFDSDFSFDNIAKALTGRFTLEHFVSDEGLVDLLLVMIGVSTGLSFPWLASSLANVLVALVYTGFKHLKNRKSSNELRPILRPGGV